MATINFTWWNLENFFDTDDDPISQDFEFTVAEGWTEEVLQAKLANLAQALNATHGNAGPELLAVAEIEKDTLLEQLIAKMGNANLKVVKDPTGTSDLRGIDVAMAYDINKLELVSSKSHVVHLRYATRDIFEVVFTVNETGERLVVIASHWPSRRLGQYESEPARITLAENIAYLVDHHLKFEPKEYEALRAAQDLAAVQARWETKILLCGDFNDEPGDRSVTHHLLASRELERVTGETNDIDQFKQETADYRAQEFFLYNAMWKFAGQQNVGTHFFSGSATSVETNRYSLLDQIVASRGLLHATGLRLDLATVAIFNNNLVATPSGRPRKFDRQTKKGTSDHLPVTAVLRF